MMDSIPVPKIIVLMTVEIEVEYNSFFGKTPEELAETIQDKMADAIMDSDRRILGVNSNINSIETHD